MTDDALPATTTADEKDRSATVALLPIGSFEQHGPYLPLATDTVIACAIADRLATEHPVLRLPPVTLSCSHEHHAWPGTVSISATTLHAVITDVADSLRRSGVPKLVLVNGHGGNYVLRNIVQESSVDGPAMALFPTGEDWADAHRTAGIETSSYADMHAGEIETSILLHARPDLVREGQTSADHDSGDRRHMLTRGLSPYSTNGVVGRPSLATAAKGRALLDGLAASFADCLGALGER